jgi:hypothetical protein
MLFLWGFLLAPVASHAQSDNLPAVEGYVFDKKTLRPLQDASVGLVTEIDASGARLSQGGFTDANGFYSFTVLAPAESVSRTLTVECNTRRGIASSTITLYATLQQNVYRRDLYVTLPRNMTACQRP